MTDCEFWIWLQRALGYGARIDDIVNCFGSARKLYEAGKREWMLSGLFTGPQIGKLSSVSPSESGKIINECRKNHWFIITPDDREYPPLLREICDFPAVLYVDGNPDVLADELFIAMVGTRRASDYSIKAATVISSILTNAGLTVVSGGALGVDSASHNGAVNLGKPTVCVLGCGLGTDYLKENEALRREISRNGAVVTEFAPFTEATRFTFPMRNRIISGMSLGTLVVEAGERSGSLITARLAAEQNRDVYAVPGSVFASSFNGANRLIRDGAKPVFTARDIVEEYYYRYPDRLSIENTDIPLSKALEEYRISTVSKPEKNSKPSVKAEAQAQPAQPKPMPQKLTDSAKAVWQAIEGETELDEIVVKSGLGIQRALSGLTELEMLGAVEMLPGRKYKKI